MIATRLKKAETQLSGSSDILEGFSKALALIVVQPFEASPILLDPEPDPVLGSGCAMKMEGGFVSPLPLALLVLVLVLVLVVVFVEDASLVGDPVGEAV